MAHICCIGSKCVQRGEAVRIRIDITPYQRHNRIVRSIGGEPARLPTPKRWEYRSIPNPPAFRIIGGHEDNWCCAGKSLTRDNVRGRQCLEPLKHTSLPFALATQTPGGYESREDTVRLRRPIRQFACLAHGGERHTEEMFDLEEQGSCRLACLAALAFQGELLAAADDRHKFVLRFKLDWLARQLETGF